MQSATIFFGLALLVATVSADGLGLEVAKDIYAYPAYKYSYGVSDKLTGDQKSALEIRDGDITKGSYSLVQPDGVLRTVNYVVTPKGGFQAQVINKGISGHPAIVKVGKGIGAIAAPGLALGGLGLGVGKLGVVGPVGGLGLGSGYGLGLGSSYGLGLGYGLGAVGIIG